jgi:hypothetical protein
MADEIDWMIEGLVSTEHDLEVEIVGTEATEEVDEAEAFE